MLKHEEELGQWDEILCWLFVGFVIAIIIFVLAIPDVPPITFAYFIFFLLFLIIRKCTVYFNDWVSVGITTKTGHVTFSREDFKNKNSPRYKFLRYLRKRGVYNVEQATIFFAKEGVDLEEEIACFEDLYKQKISEDFWDNKY